MDDSTQLLHRVMCDPNIMHGAPCIRGTRIPVSMLVANLADLTMEQFLAEFPQLTRDDLRAARSFAATDLPQAQ